MIITAEINNYTRIWPILFTDGRLLPILTLTMQVGRLSDFNKDSTDNGIISRISRLKCNGESFQTIQILLTSYAQILSLYSRPIVKFLDSILWP